MAAHLLDDIPLTLDPDHPGRVHAFIGDDWRIIFTQGGVVMSTMLRAATLVLHRPDLRLSAMSATFVAPVNPGPVVIDVTVLRSGKGAAQCLVELRAEPDGPVNSVITAVFAAVDESMPRNTDLVFPEAFRTLPTREQIDAIDWRTVPFLKQTDWIETREQPPADVTDVNVWFRFHNPPTDERDVWERTAIVVPADQLGGAVDKTLGRDTAFCVSLQITIQFYGEARGEWIAVQSKAWEIGDGLASGLATVWDAHGTLVATATQTAKLRLSW